MTVLVVYDSAMTENDHIENESREYKAASETDLTRDNKRINSYSAKIVSLNVTL